jgi:SAM-dependent methyltransferase
MKKQMATNFGAAAADFARFRAGFPDSLFDRLAALGIGASGETIVDVGTGTGTLARGFALRGCKVIGIDPDGRLIDQARILDVAASVTVEYKLGTAEAIPLPDGVADVVSAGQCWHWFEGLKAAKEFSRITKPHGRVVVAYFSWLTFPGNVVEATERLIKKHNRKWKFKGGIGVDFRSLRHLQAAGFSMFETFSYDLDVPYTAEGWRGRIRASAGVGASLAPAEVEAFDAELARLLEESFPGDSLEIPHRVFTIIAARRLSGAAAQSAR